jgi:hypothetical protein
MYFASKFFLIINNTFLVFPVLQIFFQILFFILWTSAVDQDPGFHPNLGPDPGFLMKIFKKL